MRRHLILGIGLLAAILVPQAWAQDDERKNKVGLGIGWFDPTGEDALVADSVTLPGPGNPSAGFTLAYTWNETGGLLIDYERMITERMGVLVSVLPTRHDLDVGISLRPPVMSSLPPNLEELDGQTLLVGDTTIVPVTAGTTFHLVRNGRIDFQLVLPIVGWAWFDDLDLDESTAMTLEENGLVFDTEEELEGSFVFGIGAVLDVPFGSGRWNFSSSLRYLIYETELTVEIVDDSEMSTTGRQIVSTDVEVNPLVFHAGVAYRF